MKRLSETFFENRYLLTLSIAVILAEKLSHIPDSVKVVLFPNLA